jgi:hypothetical protein
MCAEHSHAQQLVVHRFSPPLLLFAIWHVQLVKWDGRAYVWEGGANRRLRPGLLVQRATQPGQWAEVLHCLYWGDKTATGRTPVSDWPVD